MSYIMTRAQKKKTFHRNMPTGNPYIAVRGKRL